MVEQLIIFTRYPEPGKTKTRLIPVLGEIGAAQIHSKLTKDTLNTARQFIVERPASLAIYFDGGNQELMSVWLGNNFLYKKQCTGDLGERMKFAFQQEFKTGKSPLVLIGTDCPELDKNILNKAFDALKSSDVVLGPASDGGYYLIGLVRLIPQLFTGISWGTSEVLAQTQAIAEKLALSIYELPTLNDIDRPEDLNLFPGEIS